MLRSEVNPEEKRNLIDRPTKYMVGQNQSRINCGICGAAYYVDKETARRVKVALEEGLDNPFVCEDCSDEYNELAHER